MQTYELLVENRAVKPNSKDMTLVRTSVGIDQVHVLFDSAEWLDFPIKITFAQGEDVVTQSLVVSEITDSDKWVAEATVAVPYEVIDMVGRIRVTFQGTDADGRHIITAKGSPLSVEEAGDVVDGAPPADAPTTDEWQQAYSNAVAETNRLASLANSFEEELDSRVNAIMEEIYERVEETVDSYNHPATTTSLGLVRIGTGLSITEEGLLSTLATNGMTQDQVSQLRNLAALAYYCFDTEFDDDGYLVEGARLKGSAIPVDGTTVTVGEDGVLTLAAGYGDDGRY